VNFSRVTSAAALMAGAASLVVGLTACGSDSDSSAAGSSTTTTVDPANVYLPEELPEQTPDPNSSCPTAMPPTGGTPEWTLSGAAGSVSVIGSTDSTAPSIEVQAPFSVGQTQVQTLTAGDGPVVAPDATVLVCYMGVNGRDGSVFDSSYERGVPADFPLDGVVTGFQKAIAGQTVGSTVAVAMTPEDGYPEGQPAAGILPGDTLIFAIKILDAAN